MIHVDPAAGRTELHDLLKLTGAEVSVNKMPAGAAVPFVHRHQKNEEIYGVLEGSGQIWLDGKVVDIKAGDWFKVDPSVARALKVGDKGIGFICIQVKAHSLEGFTMTDGLPVEGVCVPWLQG